jgi:hypothetical protein
MLFSEAFRLTPVGSLQLQLSKAVQDGVITLSLQ